MEEVVKATVPDHLVTGDHENTYAVCVWIRLYGVEVL